MILIRLSGKHLILPLRLGAYQCQGKREEVKKTERTKKKKGCNRQKAKIPTPIRKIDALIGFEEQNRKQMKEKRARPQTSYPGPFGRLLRPAWIIRWAYFEKLPTPRPHGDPDTYMEK